MRTLFIEGRVRSGCGRRDIAVQITGVESCQARSIGPCQLEQLALLGTWKDPAHIRYPGCQKANGGPLPQGLPRAAQERRSHQAECGTRKSIVMGIDLCVRHREVY